MTKNEMLDFIRGVTDYTTLTEDSSYEAVSGMYDKLNRVLDGEEKAMSLDEAMEFLESIPKKH